MAGPSSPARLFLIQLILFKFLSPEKESSHFSGGIEYISDKESDAHPNSVSLFIVHPVLMRSTGLIGL